MIFSVPEGKSAGPRPMILPTELCRER